MTSLPASLRRQRLRTSLALATAAGAIVAGALWTPRGPRPQPRTVGGAASGSQYLSASLVSSHILPGLQETFVAVSLAAPEDPTAAPRRGPASVAIVLDRSSSMKGIAFEQARAAAIELVERLDAADELTLVTYSTEARVDVPLVVADEVGRARTIAALRDLAAGGSTNIGAALSVGADAVSAGSRAVKRVVLISDGRPVDGLVDPGQLITLGAERAARGVSITTVGVGLEYNEELMTGLAIAGRGSYYFVEHTSQLAQMFASELDSLGRIAVVDGTLTIAPAPGVELLGALGYPSRPGPGGALLVPIADLRAGERTKVVLRVRVDVSAASSSVALADVAWSFRTVGGAARTLTARAAAAVTRDASIVARHRDADTFRLVEQAVTADAIEQASTAYADGKVDRVHAILQERAAASAAYDDHDLRRQILEATQAAESGFAAPAAAPEGQRALKANRAGAYRMAR